MVEENACDAAASRVAGPHRLGKQYSSRSGEALIRSSEERDRSRHLSIHSGGLECEHWDEAARVACRSIPYCLHVWPCSPALLDGGRSFRACCVSISREPAGRLHVERGLRHGGEHCGAHPESSSFAGRVISRTTCSASRSPSTISHHRPPAPCY